MSCDVAGCGGPPGFDSRLISHRVAPTVRSRRSWTASEVSNGLMVIRWGWVIFA